MSSYLFHFLPFAVATAAVSLRLFHFNELKCVPFSFFLLLSLTLVCLCVIDNLIFSILSKRKFSSFLSLISFASCVSFKCHQLRSCSFFIYVRMNENVSRFLLLSSIPFVQYFGLLDFWVGGWVGVCACFIYTISSAVDLSMVHDNGRNWFSPSFHCLLSSSIAFFTFIDIFPFDVSLFSSSFGIIQFLYLY